MRNASGTYQPVYAKGPVIRLITEIATVSPIFIIFQLQVSRMKTIPERAAINFLCNTLINPVPDSTSGNTSIGIDYIPKFLKVAL